MALQSPFDNDFLYPPPPVPNAPAPPRTPGANPWPTSSMPVPNKYGIVGGPPDPMTEPDPTNLPPNPAPQNPSPGPTPPGPPKDSRCPDKNGIKRMWDEGRQRCTYAGGCPPGQGYVPSKTPGTPGKQGCQPCPPGTSVSEQGRCLPGLNGSGGPGGGGGGGGGGMGGPMATPYGPSANVIDFNNDLEKYIRDLLESPSRFTPEIMQQLYGQVAAQSSGAIARGEEAVRADAAQRGASRFGQTSAALRDVRNTAEANRGQTMVGVQLQKINADYQDKMGALDRAQKFLDSMRDSEYRYTLLAEQRRQFDANLALGYANLAQNKELLSMQLQSQWDMLSASMSFSLLGQGV